MLRYSCLWCWGGHPASAALIAAGSRLGQGVLGACLLPGRVPARPLGSTGWLQCQLPQGTHVGAGPPVLCPGRAPGAKARNTVGKSCWAGQVSESAMWRVAPEAAVSASCGQVLGRTPCSRLRPWCSETGVARGWQCLTPPAFGRYPHHLRPQVPAGVQEFTRGQDPSLLPAPDPRCHIPGPVQPRQAGGAQGAE